MSPRVYAAVDIGASGGRVMAGRVSDGRLDLDAVHRFPNGVVARDGHLRWDFDRLLDEVRTGLARIPAATSIGISTWAVDYGLLDAEGHLLAQPIAYRDDRTAKVIDDVHASVSPEELYAINGLQFLPFNTLYQLAAEQRSPTWDRASHVVLLPDLLAQRLTGVLRTEVTNASTTGLLDARTHEWSTTLLHRLGVPPAMLPALDAPGELRGTTGDGTPVVTVGSHDTASAVVAVPATSDRFAYIASGTWSLVGLELPAPVLTEAARGANFTNELGVDHRTRFLRNVGGLWLLQECLRTWGRDDLQVLLAQAATAPPGGPSIDVDDPAFIPPGGMPDRIAAATGRADLEPSQIVRCILDSLAMAYARTIHLAAELAGATVEVVHIVGGGSQNQLLCQLTADATGRLVLAGPIEATARGNVIVQARADGMLPGRLEEIRARMAATLELRRYEPR
jgi:rhamnulokinase